MATSANREPNPCNKTRPSSKPYEIWRAGGWTWEVLRKYQAPGKERENIYARWFCNVKSPFVPEGEMGDVFVREIYSVGAVRVYRDPTLEQG